MQNSMPPPGGGTGNARLGRGTDGSTREPQGIPAEMLAELRSNGTLQAATRLWNDLLQENPNAGRRAHLGNMRPGVRGVIRIFQYEDGLQNLEWLRDVPEDGRAPRAVYDAGMVARMAAQTNPPPEPLTPRAERFGGIENVFEGTRIPKRIDPDVLNQEARHIEEASRFYNEQVRNGTARTAHANVTNRRIQGWVRIYQVEDGLVEYTALSVAPHASPSYSVFLAIRNENERRAGITRREESRPQSSDGPTASPAFIPETPVRRPKSIDGTPRLPGESTQAFSTRRQMEALRRAPPPGYGDRRPGPHDPFEREDVLSRQEIRMIVDARGRMGGNTNATITAIPWEEHGDQEWFNHPTSDLPEDVQRRVLEHARVLAVAREIRPMRSQRGSVASLGNSRPGSRNSGTTSRSTTPAMDFSNTPNPFAAGGVFGQGPAQPSSTFSPATNFSNFPNPFGPAGQDPPQPSPTFPSATNFSNFPNPFGPAGQGPPQPSPTFPPAANQGTAGSASNNSSSFFGQNQGPPAPVVPPGKDVDEIKDDLEECILARNAAELARKAALDGARATSRQLLRSDDMIARLKAMGSIAGPGLFRSRATDLHTTADPTMDDEDTEPTTQAKLIEKYNKLKSETDATDAAKAASLTKAIAYDWNQRLGVFDTVQDVPQGYTFVSLNEIVTELNELVRRNGLPARRTAPMPRVAVLPDGTHTIVQPQDMANLPAGHTVYDWNDIIKELNRAKSDKMEVDIEDGPRCNVPAHTTLTAERDQAVASSQAAQSQLEQQRKDHDASATKVVEDARAIDTRRQQAEQKVEDLEETVKNLNNQLTTGGKAYTTVDGQRAWAVERIGELEKQLNETNALGRSVLAQRDTANTSVTALETQLQTARTTISTAETSRATTERRTTELVAELATANTNLTNAQTALQTVQAELATSTTASTTARTTLQTAETDLKTARDQLTLVRSDLEDAQTDLTTAKSELLTAQTSLTTSEGELATAKAELQTAQTNLTTSTSQISTAAASLSAVQTELETTKTALKDEQTKGEDCEQRVQALQDRAERKVVKSSATGGMSLVDGEAVVNPPDQTMSLEECVAEASRLSASQRTRQETGDCGYQPHAGLVKDLEAAKASQAEHEASSQAAKNSEASEKKARETAKEKHAALVKELEAKETELKATRDAIAKASERENIPPAYQTAIDEGEKAKAAVEKELKDVKTELETCRNRPAREPMGCYIPEHATLEGKNTRIEKEKAALQKRYDELEGSIPKGDACNVKEHEELQNEKDELQKLLDDAVADSTAPDLCNVTEHENLQNNMAALQRRIDTAVPATPAENTCNVKDHGDLQEEKDALQRRIDAAVPSPPAANTCNMKAHEDLQEDKDDLQRRLDATVPSTPATNTCNVKEHDDLKEAKDTLQDEYDTLKEMYNELEDLDPELGDCTVPAHAELEAEKKKLQDDYDSLYDYTYLLQQDGWDLLNHLVVRPLD